ncbi:hypothetical protein K8W59_04985 [Nocardioides rotundus]|uniref:hypothetical protein n=1 Tax=Nocardioides rotundus TaxID=1774216 RepID=UPI001CBE5A58|nr:hypothetical protein [Nocardioides rotundus]UAL30860.1 hypothetical protein K8W59_04985 [Nocardioides rotundus]
MLRATVTALLAPLAVGALPASAAAADPWQPAPQGSLTLPAERYCGDFDLQADPIRQAVEQRVEESYESGAPRVVAYRGALLVELTNLTSGATARVSLSGHSTATLREDGTMETYETNGPVGMGWPTGTPGMDPGFYLLNGRHVVGFAPDDSRAMLVDQGTESDLCERVS